MNRQLAHLRSPAALLTCLALLCAALAGIVALGGRAHAAVELGKFTLTPATGKISDDPMSTSATAGAGCPDPTSTQYTAILKVYKPTDANVQTNLAQSETKVPLGTAPFTLGMKSLAGTTRKSLEQALRVWTPEGSLDGTYTLGLGCGGGTAAAGFLAKVRVTGDTWTLLEQQATTLTLTPAAGVSVGGDLKLSATVAPSTAAGIVEFKQGDTSLGTATVTGGTADLTVKAPAVGGPTAYSAVFTPTDPDAYASSRATAGATIGYLVSAKDADGKDLAAAPTLYIGQKVKVTAQGFAPGATAEVTLSNSNATFADVTVNADGAIADYAFTVPDALPNGEHGLHFSGSSGVFASFDFVSTDESPSSPTPTEPADLDVTDEGGNALDADPALEPGQTVKITARGYTEDATVKVTLADSEATFEDAKANAEGTVEKYAFTVPEDIEDGEHTLTLAEDKTDGHSVDFAFSTGEDSSTSPEPSASDTSGTGTSGGDGGGSDTGGTTGGDSGGTGTMAATGTQVGAIGLTALALLSAGAALVLHMRRRGLLTFGEDSPQHR
ncbi:hypothetical protein AB0O75_32800 [Streptomyces sp. NPDC088921]|uniref:hypothetical protein n=1 Tax=unclassified Streptomyces TaxID=2593676 RepID=UPI003449E965